jgi:polysaccharide biosynthesis/export protein
VNSMKIRCFIAFLFNQKVVLSLSLFILCFGCSDKVTLPTALQLTEFENAGPLLPSLDTKNLVNAKIQSRQYQVMPGEVLEFTMPAILQAVTKDEYKEGERYAPYMCRISDSGTITLPLVGELKAAGLNLTQIENAVIEKYYPEYAVTRPSVFARIVEYKTYRVSITGAINKPGIYTLHNDQMTLVSLLMEAGGIVNEGAAVIKIIHPEHQVSNNDRITQGKYEQKTIQASQQLTDKVDKTFLNGSVKNSAGNKQEVQLSFKQTSQSSTDGILTVRGGEEILITKQLNIANLDERLLVVKELLRDNRISILELDEKLSSLASRLDSHRETRRQAETITAKDNSKELQSSIADSQFARISNEFDSENKIPENGFPGSNSSITHNSTLLSEYQSSNIGAIKNDAAGMVQTDDVRTVVLPVKGLNIPFADVVLEDGDSVVVERMQMPIFSVLGLVNKPSNFQYPPDVQYNLMQALAFAGGLDRAAEPRYATIYRLKPDGTIAHAIFQVVNVKDRAKLTYALNTIIKPGDIIAVEHTPRTRTKMFLDSAFRFNIGTYYNLADAFED